MHEGGAARLAELLGPDPVVVLEAVDDDPEEKE